MSTTRLILLAAASSMVLGGCDFVRFPGDGGPPPQTPDAGPAVPPGAPGPPPPSTPIEDPYGNGDSTPDTDTSDTANTAPDTGTDTDPVPGTGPDTGTDDAPADDTSEPDTDNVPDTTNTDTLPDDTASDPDTDADTNTDAGTDDTPGDQAAADTGTSTPDPQPLPPSPAPEPVFSYHAPGALLPGSGQGNTEEVVHAPDIVFPIESDPSYLQSMVFTFGGGVAGGDQCDTRNFTYPWRDNFCETRTSNRNSPYCPTSKIHQGQDIRVGTPESCNLMRGTAAAERMLHKVIAVEDGVISNVGSYSVNLRAGGRIYKYMHMNMEKLQVKLGDSVKAGDHLGYVSNDFAGTPTTFHLHFEITQNNGDGDWVHVPPYLSLVEAYERREDGVGEAISSGDIAIASAPIIIPEGMEIIE